MSQPVTVDGRTLVPITPAVAMQARHFLPALPGAPGVIWITVRLPDTPLRIVDTCWLPTYNEAHMQPAHFTGWHCLNPIDEGAA